MDPQRLLQRICDRHGVAFSEAERLVPLVGRALVSKPDVRDKILALVERNIARRGAGAIDAPAERVFEDLDEEVLASVAQVLHAWNPKGRTLDLSDALPGLFPPGFEFG